MRINNNITALNAHRNYTINNSSIGKNVEKLSSGYRINRAGDDAAGLAISEKMRAQIRGLTMASKNSQDAISLVQTAEGALQSTHDILQRMREIAVQSSSDTNETGIDRAALQQEYAALKAEIDDISTTTRFNDQNLLDGTFQAIRTTLNNPESTIDNIKAISVARAGGGEYTMDIKSTAAVPTDITAGAQCNVFDDGLLNMASMSDKVSAVTFSGLETSANDGNIYTLQVEGSDVANMTFHLLDTNGDKVATAQNVNTAAWSTTSSAANIVSFSGVGTFEFALSETITDVSNLTSLSGSKVEFLTDGGTANEHTITINSDFTAVTTSVNADLADVDIGTGGAISMTYNAPTDPLTMTMSSATAPVFSTTSSVDDKGNITVSVLNENGDTVVSDTKSIIGLAAGATLDLDLGAYGSVTIENTDTGAVGIVGATTTAVYDSDGTGYVANSATAAGTIAAGTDFAAANGTVTGGTFTATPGTIVGAYTSSTAGVTITHDLKTNATSDGVDAGTITINLQHATLGEYNLTMTIAQNTDIDSTTFRNSIAATINAFTATITDSGNTITTGGASLNAADGAETDSSAVTAQIETEGGQAQVSSLANRAFMTLTINGESVNLYKGDTYANFSEQGISFSFEALSDADIMNTNYFTTETDTSTANTSILIATNENQGKSLVIQSGANQGDELKINIDRISSETLGLSYSNISTREAASSAITEVNDAINQVSTQRAALGALQNRLEFKIANLDISAENLQAAESRIRDVDMAKEMTSFTKNNILAQASTAMLAQANSLPQGVLQLLG